MQKRAAAMREEKRFSSLGRSSFAAFLALSVIAAALLTDAPGWHQHLHPNSGSGHICLVTVLAGGQCEAATAAPVSAMSDASPALATLPLAVLAPLPAEHFFSLLEHAPPPLA